MSYKSMFLNCHLIISWLQSALLPPGYKTLLVIFVNKIENQEFPCVYFSLIWKIITETFFLSSLYDYRGNYVGYLWHRLVRTVLQQSIPLFLLLYRFLRFTYLSIWVIAKWKIEILILFVKGKLLCKLTCRH